MVLGDFHHQVHGLLGDFIFQVGSMHGSRVAPQAVFHPVVQDEGVKDGRQNQPVFPVMTEETAEGPFPEFPVRRVEQGQHLAPGHFLFLSLDRKAKGKRTGEFVKERHERGPSGHVLQVQDLFFFLPQGEFPETAEELESVFIGLQGFVI